MAEYCHFSAMQNSCTIMPLFGDAHFLQILAMQNSGRIMPLFGGAEFFQNLALQNNGRIMPLFGGAEYLQNNATFRRCRIFQNLALQNSAMHWNLRIECRKKLPNFCTAMQTLANSEPTVVFRKHTPWQASSRGHERPESQQKLKRARAATNTSLAQHGKVKH